jgi:ketopantoate reductase
MLEDNASMKAPMKILVYGAGVIGTLYAARLQQEGHQVTILARGSRLADIRRQRWNIAIGRRLQLACNACLSPADSNALSMGHCDRKSHKGIRELNSGIV